MNCEMKEEIKKVNAPKNTSLVAPPAPKYQKEPTTLWDADNKIADHGQMMNLGATPVEVKHGAYGKVLCSRNSAAMSNVMSLLRKPNF